MYRRFPHCQPSGCVVAHAACERGVAPASLIARQGCLLSDCVCMLNVRRTCALIARAGRLPIAMRCARAALRGESRAEPTSSSHHENGSCSVWRKKNSSDQGLPSNRRPIDFRSARVPFYTSFRTPYDVDLHPPTHTSNIGKEGDLAPNARFRYASRCARVCAKVDVIGEDLPTRNREALVTSKALALTVRVRYAKVYCCAALKDSMSFSSDLPAIIGVAGG